MMYSIELSWKDNRVQVSWIPDDPVCLSQFPLNVISKPSARFAVGCGNSLICSVIIFKKAATWRICYADFSDYMRFISSLNDPGNSADFSIMAHEANIKSRFSIGGFEYKGKFRFWVRLKSAIFFEFLNKAG